MKYYIGIYCFQLFAVHEEYNAYLSDSSCNYRIGYFERKFQFEFVIGIKIKSINNHQHDNICFGLILGKISNISNEQNSNILFIYKK